MKKLLKIFVLLFILSLQAVFANTASQNALDKATTFYKKQDYKQALKWAKISFEEKKSKAVAFNIGLVYKKLEDYDNAIKWYEKSFEMGDVEGGLNTAQLYKNKFNDVPNAIKWYKKVAKKGHKNAINNLGEIYHDLIKDNITASAYILAGIEYGYDKKQTLKYLKDTWKVTDAELKKAYELQKTLDIPRHYTGSIE